MNKQEAKTLLKELLEKLLKNARLLLREPCPNRKEQNKLIKDSVNINIELYRLFGYKGFDDLAYFVARSGLSDERYYEILKLCGLEVQ